MLGRKQKPPEVLGGHMFQVPAWRRKYAKRFFPLTTEMERTTVDMQDASLHQIMPKL